jgi:hypothetical protein
LAASRFAIEKYRNPVILVTAVIAANAARRLGAGPSRWKKSARAKVALRGPPIITATENACASLFAKAGAEALSEVKQTGTGDHTPVYPREVVERALELSATAIILVHTRRDEIVLGTWLPYSATTTAVTANASRCSCRGASRPDRRDCSASMAAFLVSAAVRLSPGDSRF